MYREPLKKHTIFPNAKLCNPHAIWVFGSKKHATANRAIESAHIEHCGLSFRFGWVSLSLSLCVHNLNPLSHSQNSRTIFFPLSVLIWCSIGYFWIMQIRLMCWMKLSVSVYFLCVFNSGRVWSKARAWLYHINCTVWMVFFCVPWAPWE